MNFRLGSLVAKRSLGKGKSASSILALGSYRIYTRKIIAELLKRSTRADCKSAGLALRRFESYTQHFILVGIAPPTGGFESYTQHFTSVGIAPPTGGYKSYLQHKKSSSHKRREKMRFLATIYVGALRISPR